MIELNNIDRFQTDDAGVSGFQLAFYIFDIARQCFGGRDVVFYFSNVVFGDERV